MRLLRGMEGCHDDQDLPLTRREVLFYFFFGALLLLALLLTGIVSWAVTPPRDFQRVGALADFPPSEQPHHVFAGQKSLWVVNTGSEVLALEPRARFAGCQYHVVWVPTNARFEDPCSGLKFTLHGDWLTEANLRVERNVEPHGLDRYAVSVRGDELWVDLTAPTPGPIQ